jgi:formylglycine-generating enzyme required for sulfatase activity
MELRSPIVPSPTKWVARLSLTLLMFIAGTIHADAQEATDRAPEQSPPSAGTLMPVTMYGMEFVYIPDGEFLMGMSEAEGPEAVAELNKYYDVADESWVRGRFPQHRVIMSRPFEMMRYEVTQGQWQRVMGTTLAQQVAKATRSRPGLSEGENYPMHTVSWEDAQEFIERLNQQGDGYTYRLPTEAEWEYAARAGTTTRFYWGDDPEATEICRFANSGDQAWLEVDPDRVTARCNDGYARAAPVGSFLPNAWGLYDMSGNVYEWVGDWVGDYERGPVRDPTGPSSGEDRVRRGAGAGYIPPLLASSSRSARPPDWLTGTTGFRLVRLSNGER